MNISELSEDLEFIKKLGTYPNQDQGLSADDLKAEFDKAANIIKQYLNDIIVPALNKTLTAEEILKKIASGGDADVDLGDREFSASKIAVDTIEAEGFYMESSLVNGDFHAPVARFGGTHSDNPVILRNIAPGINGDDAVNKKQLEETIEPLIVTIYNNDSLEFVATHTPDEIYNAALSQRKVFLQTKDGYFPFVFADDSRALFAQADYEEGKILGYYVLEDGTAEAIEKVIAFTNQVPRIDDDVVSPDKIWSSKNTVDRLCPAFKESGTLVQCEPLAGYPLNVKSYFEAPLYEGEKLTLTRCGKNLYNKDVFPLTDDRALKNDGTAGTSSTFCACIGYIPVAHLRGKTITLNHPPTEYAAGTNARSVFYDKDKRVISASSSGKLDVPDNAYYFRFTTKKEYLDGKQIQIEIGSAATVVEPYYEESWSVDLQETDSPVMFDWTSGIFYTDGYDSQLLEEPPSILGKGGVNTFYSNLGDTEIIGRGDIAKRIEQLEAAIISMGSNV